MGTTHVFSIGSTPRIEPNGNLSERWQQQSRQQLWTQMSLNSLSFGFLLIGMLILAHPHLAADLPDLSNDGLLATVSGLGALVIGSAFTIAAYQHWRARPRSSPLPTVRRNGVRLAFSAA